MKKVGIMQPYFMPYIGYWQLIKYVDTYVFFDDVNYIKKGWVNRNNILINGNAGLFTISLNNASQNKLINEISISDDFIKFNKTIDFTYHKAPYYQETRELLNIILSYSKNSLSKFIGNSIQVISKYLEINTEFISSSDIIKNENLKAQEKIIDICKILKANTYINAIGGVELYKQDIFTKSNITLQFLKPTITKYKQFKNNFISDLSIIDILMFNSKEDINIQLDKFELINNSPTLSMELI